MFKKATKKRAKLRLAIIGPSGAGKTYTGLTLTCALSERVAVIDTEHGSASKYADLFGFDVLELSDFHPLRYVEALAEAAKAGYGGVLIDSLSHAWVGKGGALELHDAAVAKQRTTNKFTAWGEVTPHHNALIYAIVQSPLHVVATMRAKTAYEIEEGTKRVKKVGTAPVQRDGMEYEFDLVGDMDLENTLVISKTRCPALNNAVIRKPTKALAETLLKWLDAGEAAPAPPPRTTTPADAPKLTEQQRNEIKRLLKECGLSLDDLKKKAKTFGKDDPKTLTEGEASRVIADLNNYHRRMPRDKQPAVAANSVPREPGIDDPDAEG